MFFSFGQREGASAAGLMRLNAKVARLLEHLRLGEAKEEFSSTVAQLWAAGDRIGAIRAYREETGDGLKEAKDALEGGLAPMMRLERNIDRLLQHHALSTESPLPELPQVIEEIQRGRKIHAIKAYRNLTGADLREAKEFVDDLEIQLRETGRL